MLLSGILPQESPNYKDPEKCGAALCRRGEETILINAHHCLPQTVLWAVLMYSLFTLL